MARRSNKQTNGHDKNFYHVDYYCYYLNVLIGVKRGVIAAGAFMFKKNMCQIFIC